MTLTLIEALLGDGFAVDLILERRQGEYLDRIPAGARVIILRRYAKRRAYAQLIAARPAVGTEQLVRNLVPGADYLPLRRLPSMADYFKHESPDIVFASHGRLPILAVLARAVARVKTPIVIVEHSTLSRWLDVFWDQPEKHRRWRYRCRLARRFYREAERVVGVSQGVTRDLIKTLDMDVSRTATLYNPVVSESALTADYDCPDHPWFARDEPPVVLAVGRLVKEKNFGELISAFACLRRTHAVRLMILGEGEMREVLSEQIRTLGLAEDVILPGWVDCPQQYMQHSRVFVVSSLFEGLGIVVVEAMAAGCPVVSVDCPSGPREILADGRHGTLVPPHDTEGLARAIADTLDAPRPVDELRARAGDFSVDNGVAAYRRLMDMLISPTDV